jgi:hypothetical protein
VARCWESVLGYVIRSVRGSGQGIAESGDVLGERFGLSKRSGLEEDKTSPEVATNWESDWAV